MTPTPEPCRLCGAPNGAHEENCEMAESESSAAQQANLTGEGPRQGDTVPLAASAAGPESAPQVETPSASDGQVGTPSAPSLPPATADELEKDLLRATSIGISIIFTRCGAYSELSPYMKERFDELQALHSKCERAFNANIAKAAADQNRTSAAQDVPSGIASSRRAADAIDLLRNPASAAGPATADTPTPMTDANTYMLGSQRAKQRVPEHCVVDAIVSIQLERELAAATAKLEACCETAEKDGELFAELIEKKRSAEHASTQWKQAWSESEDRVIAERKARDVEKRGLLAAFETEYKKLDDDLRPKLKDANVALNAERRAREEADVIIRARVVELNELQRRLNVAIKKAAEWNEARYLAEQRAATLQQEVERLRVEAKRLNYILRGAYRAQGVYVGQQEKLLWWLPQVGKLSGEANTIISSIDAALAKQEQPHE